MRMSCNGCRVLRKGCSEDCSIRPCLQWIKKPESQANATVFLAKFYGRAGLMNLINAGPEHLRPAIFRSLLYEACGRIVNPIYGSVGLLWSGSWQLCQAAVEAVLKGAPIMQIASEAAANSPVPPLSMASNCDIRHVSKDEVAAAAAAAAAAAVDLRGAGPASAAANDLHKVNKATRRRFKRPGGHGKGHQVSGLAEEYPTKIVPRPGSPEAEPATDPESNLQWRRGCPVDFYREASDDSSASQASGPDAAGTPCTGKPRGDGENESMVSAESAEGSMVTSHGMKADDGAGEDDEVKLELTLGFEPVHHSTRNSSGSGGSHNPSRNASRPTGWRSRETCSVDLALELAA